MQAHKRGLDVGKLHDSQTPAWRNLRGRGSAGQKRQSYFEGPEDEDDELADQASEEGQEEEESSSEASSAGWQLAAVAFLDPSVGGTCLQLAGKVMRNATCSGTSNPCWTPADNNVSGQVFMAAACMHVSRVQSSEEEEEGEEQEEKQPRYARRVRQTVQRYSPPKDTLAAAAKSSGGGGSGGGRRDRGAGGSKHPGYPQDGDDSDSEEVRGGSAF